MSRRTVLPVLIIVAGLIAVIMWQRSRRSEPPSSADAGKIAPDQTLHEPPGNTTEVNKLKGQLAEEMRARKSAEAETAALREKVRPLESNVVVSLGRVEDIGKRAALFLPSVEELKELSARDAGTLTGEEKRRLLQLQREHAQLLGALPEITRFQDNPDEYGRFFRSMFQEAGGLTDAQASQVETFMRERATLMNQQELNAAKEPTDPKLEEAWEERRDQFNAQTAEALKRLLPSGAAERIGFGPDLMEFLEMDFDKLAPRGPQ